MGHFVLLVSASRAMVKTLGSRTADILGRIKIG